MFGKEIWRRDVVEARVQLVFCPHRTNRLIRDTPLGGLIIDPVHIHVYVSQLKLKIHYLTAMAR